MWRLKQARAAWASRSAAVTSAQLHQHIAPILEAMPRRRAVPGRPERTAHRSQMLWWLPIKVPARRPKRQTTALPAAPRGGSAGPGGKKGIAPQLISDPQPTSVSRRFEQDNLTNLRSKPLAEPRAPAAAGRF